MSKRSIERSISPDLLGYELKSSIRKSAKKDKLHFSHQKDSKSKKVLDQNVNNLTDVEGFLDFTNKPSSSKPIPKTPSPRKSATNSFFNSLLCSKEKKAKTASNKVDKRLIGLQMEDRMSRNTSMLSSPSIMKTKKDSRSSTPSKQESIEIKDDAKDEDDDDEAVVVVEEIVENLNDTFDKLVESGTLEKKEQKKLPQEIEKGLELPKEEVAEKAIAIAGKSNILDVLPPIKVVSMDKAEVIKIIPDLITYMRASRNALRQAMEKVNKINATVEEFRRSMAASAPKDH